MKTTEQDRMTANGLPPRQWWSYHRREQYGKLRDLIREVTMINNGSNVIERIQRCIKLAKDLEGRSPATASFLLFLENEMFKGERPTSELRAEARKNKAKAK